MGKNLNVNLTFTANTQQAKMQIRDLQTSLNSITSGVTSKVGLGETITQDLQKANQAAMQLKVALRSATDVKTGNIDLYKLDQIFKANKMSVEQYRVALQGAGAEGQKAFAQLNQAITNAQMPIRKTSTMIDNMWTTMKNTMRWQLTSSMLMGFTSAIRKAYGYAQDLNESLNNIRIVTGQSVEQMDKFALQANKAAKRLSTTTTAYTNAALIYYQQGLSDEEVLKRTDVTVKLANVAGETAETVSEWMTAIWNNFDEGGKTLEYYADVLTALGAATASSSDEIATGIEKFSAVAKNVGLSYEYAASALATVTAQTRQSADIVGTAFKTLFTRITDLELGKGLDDGTTLGQYSQTLADVGVNIKTTSGELRNMDNILNDLGARWESLNGATRQAVAQSVAGIRQANQFIALMDNWDFFQQNLQVSLAAKGTLTDQADIYAESWGAASKRVKAAAEGIYDSILDDEFFIQITNGFADFLEGIEHVVDSMGGLKGLLPGVLALMLQLFGNKMLTSVRDFSSGLKASGAAAEKVALGLKADSAQAAKNMTSGIGGTAESVTLGENMAQQGKIQERVWSLSKNLSETEKIRLQNLERLNEEQRELTLELSKQQDSLEAQTNEYKKQVQEKQQNLNDADQLVLQAYGKRGASKARLAKAKKGVEALGNQNVFSKRNLDNDLQRTDFSGLYNSAKSLDLKNNNDVATKAVRTYINALQDYNNCQQDIIQTEQQRDQAQDRLKQSQDELTEAQRKHTEAEKNVVEQSKIQEQSYKNTMTYLDQLEKSVDWGQNVVSLATGFSQLAMAASSLQQLGSIWKNEDLSTGEKLLQTVMSLGMGLSTFVFGLKQVHSVINSDNIILMGNTLSRLANAASMTAQTNNSKKLSRQIKIESTEIDKNTGKQIVNKATRKSKDGETTYTRFLDQHGNVRFRSQKKGTAGGDISKEEGEKIFGAGSGEKDWQTKGMKRGEAAKTLGKFVPALVGLAVATGIAATAITLINKQLNKEEAAFKAARESAQRFKEEYSKIAEESNKLKDSISSYKEISSSLNDLVKGTNEYSEALIKANEQALELIKNNKNLKYEVINGQIVINQASLDQAYADQLAKQENALVQSSIATQGSNYAKITNDNAEFSEKAWTTADIGQTAAINGGATVAGAAAGTAAGAGVGITAALLSGMGIGAAAGSSFAGIGAIVGVIVGAVGGLIYGIVETVNNGVAAEAEQEALRALQKKARENPDILKDKQSVKNALGDDYDADMVDALTEDMDALRDLIASNEALRQQNIALNSTIASAIAKERGDEEYSEAINAYINNQTVNDDDYDSDWETLRESIDEEDSNLKDLYSLFYDKDTEGYITNMAGGNVTRVTYDEDGRTVEKEISQETISSEIANLIRKAALEGDTKKLKEIHELIDKSGSGDEIKEILDKYTIKSEDLDGVVQRAEANANKLTNIGFDSKDDAQIINKITGQLEGSLEDVDFSSLTREQVELIEQNQTLWSDNSKLLEKIEKGISEYETKRMSNNLQASIDFDIEQNESDELNELLKQTGMTAKEFQAYQKIIQSEYNISEDNAYGLAKANLAVQGSITDLNKKIKENSEVLNSGNKNNTKYAQSIAQISTSISAWLGVELDSTFVDEHLELIKKAAEGDKQAIKELQDLASQEFVINLDLMGDYENQLLDFTNTVNSTELTIGMTLDTTEATKNLGEFVNKMILMGQMTTKQGVAYLQSMGFEVDENDMQETTLTTDELWRSDSTLWEKIKGTASSIFTGTTGKTIKTIDLSSVQYTGEGKTADLSKITEEKEKKNRNNKKKYSDEIDRYHEIKEVMSDLERQAERLAKSKERAFGADKLALMDKEIAKQKELLQTEKDYLSEIETNYGKDRTNLLSNYAVNLDETGRITNYEEVYKQQIDRLNSIGKANNWEGDAYEKQKEAYEQFKKDIQQYEETLNLLEDQQQAVIDKQHELADLALEKIEFTVQLQVDIADDDKAYIDFLMQKIEDDAFAAADAIGLMGREVETIMSKIEANQQGIIDIQNAVANGEITPEQGAEKLREYRDELIDLNADLLEVRQTVQDKLTEAFEAWNEKIEEGTSKLEFYSSVLEGYKNIIDIVGKDMLGISDKTMNRLNQTIISNANDSIRATKAQLDANKATLENMKRAREEARARGDEEAVKDWDKQIKIAEEKVQELTTTLQDKLSTGLEAVTAAFGDTVNQIAEEFSKAVSGIYDSIEEMRQGWDRQQEVAERFLNIYEQTYEINKLNRQIQNSIDQTDNVGSQRELRDLQQEIYEMTKDGQQLSKYDLEYLQKKYDLMVAEQALKDAQNTKSVVKLTRDSEGNFGYVYTADQNAIDNAEQNYEDKLYAYQNFTVEVDKAMTEAYIAANEKYLENIAWVNENFTKGSKEYEEHMARINKEYAEDLAWITNESEKLTNRNIKINRDFSAGVADTYSKTYLGQILPNYQSFQDLYTGTTEQCEIATSRLNQAMIDLRDQIDNQLELAGYDADDFEQDINEEFGDVQDDSKDTADEVEQMAKDMDDALNGPDGAISKVEDFQEAFYGEMEKVWGETDKVIKKVKELIDEYGRLAEAAGKDYTPPAQNPETTKGNNTNTNGNNTTGNNNDITKDTDLTRKTTISKFGGKFNTKTGQFEYVQLSNGNWYNASHVKGKKIGDEVKGQAAWKTVDYTEPKTEAEKSKNINFDTTLTSKQGTNIKGFEPLDSYNDKAWSGTTGKNKSYKYDSVRYPSYGTDKNGNFKLFVKGDKYWYDITGLDINAINDNSFEFTVPAGSRRYKAFDTGGYTGNWGPEGRLAMLHQKEIVLNAHDTENFLTAIGIVRDISDQIEKNAIVMQYQNQLANYRASVGNSGETLQQEVHITAEFPNATDHNEIEEAFKNLTNLASQYANRKS